MKRFLISLLAGLMVMSAVSAVPAFAKKGKPDCAVTPTAPYCVAKAKKAERKAQKLAKPKVLQGWVAGTDAAAGLLLLKKKGAQGSIVIGTGTVVAVIEDTGARAGSLADFQAGDRVFALVRRSATDPHVLNGLVVVKMPAKQRGGEGDDDDDDEDAPPPPPPAPAACADGTDNDGDGLVDLADSGCADAADTDETDAPPAALPAACADGTDNDGDGLADLADPGCTDAADADETDAPPAV